MEKERSEKGGIAVEKNSVNRLLHTVTPFVLMVLVRKLLLLLFTRIVPAQNGGEIGDLCAFAVSAAIAVFLFRARKFEEEPEDDPVPPLPKKKTSRTVLHLIVSASALVFTMFVVAAYLNGEAAFSDTVTAVGKIPSSTFLSVLSLLIVHPLTEEYLFRRCFYGELRRMNPVFGCMAQAVMFAIAHDSVDGMFYALAAGVILGILAEETGRLWPCVAAHIFVNARSLVCVTVLADRGNVRYAMDSVLLTAGAIAFFILAVTRARFAAEPDEDEKTGGSRSRREAGV